MKTYYTYNQATKKLTVADRIIVRDGATIVLGRAEDFARYLGAYSLADPMPAPTPPEGKVVVPDGYEAIDGKWVQKWRYGDAPPRVRVFATADIIEALMQRELWPEARAWIESQGWLDMVLATKEVHDDDPNFTAARAALQEALGATDQEVEEILSYAEVR